MCLLGGTHSVIAAEQGEAAARAVPATERALAEAERKLGFLNARSLSYRRWLTGLYQIQGRHAEAATLMRREMEAFEKSEGPGSTNLASSMNQLADIYRKGGRAQEASELLQRALSIYQKQPTRRTNPPSRVMRTQRPDSGVVAKKKLVPVFRQVPPRGLPVNGAIVRVAPIAKEKATPAPPKREPTLRELQYLERARRLDQEAGELWWQKRIVDVERNYREALRYREAALGRDHPDVGQSLIRLARLYWSSNRNAEASALHRWAISILERKLPIGSMELADAMWELGGFLQIIGDHNSAQPLMSKALAVFEKDADKQTNISHRRTTYATVLKEMGRGDEAVALRR
jgi:tetratricopeptide (TPR) repeat protein